MKTRTPEATSKTAAVLEAKRLLDKGEGIPSSDPLALDFLRDFWKKDSESRIYREKVIVVPLNERHGRDGIRKNSA